MIHLTSPVKQVRLDQYLKEIYPEHSRSYLQKMIKDGHILVNDQVVKTGYMLNIDDLISIDFVEAKPLDLEPVDLKIEVIYEDDDLMVIMKPKGLVVHPAHTVSKPTLVHGLLHQAENLSGINGILRPGIVHRLDKDTSGLMLVAKHDKSHQLLSEMLSKREIKRSYKAICYGVFKHTKGTINAAIARDPNNRLKMTTILTGKPAVTHFEVLNQFAEYALVKCDLESGRTHQIRVHMKFINHPVLGDPIYGPKRVYGDEGQYLHAYKIAFMHPIKKKEMVFETPLPNSFTKFIENLI